MNFDKVIRALEVTVGVPRKYGMSQAVAEAVLHQYQQQARAAVAIKAPTYVMGPVTPKPFPPIGKPLFQEVSAISTLPYYTPGSLEHKVQSYLEDKLIEYGISTRSHLLAFKRKGKRKKTVITMFDLTPKMYREVIFPELKRIGKEFGHTARSSRPYSYRRLPKKIRVFI